MDKNTVFEWDEDKRQSVIAERGLDFVLYAAGILDDSDVFIVPDERKDYGEERYLAYGITDGMRLCLCFSVRGNHVRLITIFKIHKKQWEKHYGKNS